MSSDRPIISAPLTDEQLLAHRRAKIAQKLRNVDSSPMSPVGGSAARGPSPLSMDALSAKDLAANNSTSGSRSSSSTGSSEPASPTLSGTGGSPGVGMPKTAHYSAKETIPNTPLSASVISASLGAFAGVAFYAAARPVLAAFGAESWGWARPQLGLYLGAMGLFHLLEFWTTAGWNYQKLSVDAFLLNNTVDYQLAHAAGLAEYFISSYFWPGKFNSVFASWPVLAVAVAVLVAGQTFRSLAMVHAGRSFSHLVKVVKLEDHTLVTAGVYSLVRHPSYVGFFYWAMATQLLLSNVVSTLVFALVLSRFFGHRIRVEEVHLIQFFGDKYLAYRRKVGSGLPFLGV